MTLKIRNINVRLWNLKETKKKVVSIFFFLFSFSFLFFSFFFFGMLLKSLENAVCNLLCAGLIPSQSRHRERNLFYNESFLHIRGFAKSIIEKGPTQFTCNASTFLKFYTLWNESVRNIS